jgi:5-hydroxyisourate hydrolase
MSSITTHVLDTILGKPAAGISIRLEAKQGDAWTLVGTGTTDTDGRCRDLIQNAPAGTYRLTFLTQPYQQRHGRESIYPEIAITFTCNDEAHFHLPLLLGGNGYTTYRGS